MTIRKGDIKRIVESTMVSVLNESIGTECLTLHDLNRIEDYRNGIVDIINSIGCDCIELDRAVALIDQFIYNNKQNVAE